MNSSPNEQMKSSPNEQLGNIRLCILNYGSGNVRSVFNLFQAMQVNPVVSNSVSDIENATHLVLPGVGSFGGAMEKIRAQIPIAAVEKEVFERKKPLLGICVGMQVFFSVGKEFGEHKGLGWIPGEVRKLETGGEPLPHMGWNGVAATGNSPLFRNFPPDTDFYYLNSFACYPEDDAAVSARTNYGQDFTAAVSLGNLHGVQFHPEKSQKAGRLLFQNFLEAQ